MDIDKLFKVPKLPPGFNKRKLPDNPTPEMLKKLKMDNGSSEPEGVSSKSKGKSRVVTVEEVDDDDAMEQDRTFAPGGDADYFTEEDDEGRFFGGGLTSEQKEILNIFEKANGDFEGAQLDAEEFSSTTIRKTLLRFERAVNKNQDQRSKYPNDPSKFIDSEADLDSAIKTLLPLAQAPTTAYPELVRSDSITLLVGLLSHENVDIVIDVVEVLQELTDEDVGNGGEDEDEREAAEEALKLLIQSLLDLSILELLADNLSRLDEKEESDRQGVFHILGVFENVLDFNPQLAGDLVSKTKILPWLLNRISLKDHNENRGYAAEILSILLHDNVDNRLSFGQADGVESVLKVLSQYRRRDPMDPDETEFMENVFDALCSALSERPIKEMFLAAEGPDLMVLMTKGKLRSRSRSLKTLAFAMSGTAGFDICNSFIEALGLKSLFSALMGKASKKTKSSTAAPVSEDIGHILGIISSLLSNLAPDSPPRIRLLAKFVEENYEKVDKLLELREGATSRLKSVDKEIANEHKLQEDEGERINTEDEELWYLRRLEGGLFTLQTVDYILAWIILEDDGIRTHINQILSRKSRSITDIVETLQLYHDNIDDPQGNGAVPESEDRPPSQKEILRGLITALKGEESA